MQLNAVCRLAKIMENKEKTVMINSFVYPSFKYCSLVWHFCSYEPSQKTEEIRKRCLRLVLDDYESDYENLIKKNGITTMEIKRLRTLATEIFKTINNIDPSYMKNIFTPKPNAKIRPHDITVRDHNTATYGDKSLTALRPEIWNKLTTNIKSLTSITKFKEYVKTWFGRSYKCNVCRMVR